VRVGTAIVALMNRSIVPPARNRLPRWISSPAISPTMNAKQLLSVPRPKTSNHKAISAAGVVAQVLCVNGARPDVNLLRPRLLFVTPTIASSRMNDDPPSRVEFHAHLL
jgi:hypothetical protein